MRFLIGTVLKVISRILFFIPRPLLRSCGGMIGFLWFDLFAFRKKIVLDNLSLAMPDLSAAEKLKIGRHSVYQLGYNFSEFLLIPAINESWLDKNVVFHGAENIEQALAQKKGVLFLTMHLGNGDLAANAIAMRFCKVFIITKKFKNRLLNDIWFSIRGAKGVQHIDAHGPSNAFEILKALKKNAAVTFVVDQFMGKPYGIETNFFGVKTGTAYGLALFAVKSRAPVVPVYTYEGLDQKMHICFEPSMDFQNLIVDDKDSTILGLTQLFCDKVEEVIRRHPDQWLWVHRRWKKFE